MYTNSIRDLIVLPFFFFFFKLRLYLTKSLIYSLPPKIKKNGAGIGACIVVLAKSVAN